MTRLGVDKVKPKGWFWGLGDFGFWGLGIDNNVPFEDGGLLQVLPLTVHLNFFLQKSRGWLVGGSPSPLLVFLGLGTRA